MKNVMKRSFSLLLVLTLIVCLFSGLTFQADAAGTVNYVYSGSYIYNWGTREEEATFLSPKAEAFYQKNGTSYAELSALSGSTSTSSVPSSALYQELKSLMTTNHKKTTSYDGTRELYRYTDCQQSGKWNSGKISSFYSGKAIGPSWDSGKTWNREHTWPNSKGDASGQGENDIIMLRPASVSENSSRGSKAYGESGSYYHPNSESNGVYDLRGDVARIMLFVYCRWGNTGSMWGSSGVMESRDVLLKWVEEDPVDTWELGRNDSAESITGTRNVFVDYPELIFIMFGQAVPANMQTPSGEAAKNAYTVTATTNNSTYGTVSVNGNVITATPKTGYQVSGYTVTSGSATVTQSGNTFTVRPSSNCTVRINFAARSKYTVKFSENGYIQTTLTPYVGDALKLPAAVVGVDATYTFVGWVKSMISDTTTRPTTVYSVGNNYTATSSHTMYALYTFQYMGNTYYSTNATPCSHDDDTIAIPAVAATCTTSGNTAGRYCNDCGHYYGGYSVIASLGHNYTSVVTPPTITEQGYTTHTCNRCGDSYVSDYVEALGETYTVSFCVPSGVSAVASMSCGKNGITLPSAGVPAGETAYQFLGWTTSAVTDTTTAPQILAAGSNYKATENTSLYAVYSYLAGGTVVAGTYEKITAAPSNWEGEYVITGTVTGDGTVYAFLADGTEPNATSAAKVLNSTGMTLSGDKLTGVTDSYVVIVEKVGTHYSMRLKGASSTLYLMTANSNSGFNTAANTSATSAQWDFSWSGSEVVIRNVASTSRTLRFNASSKQFRTYTSGQNSIALYGMSGQTGTTYYTTLGSTAHQCTAVLENNHNGTHSYVCSVCGDVKSTAEHSYEAVSAGQQTATCACGNEVFAWAGMSVSLESSLQATFVVQAAKLPESGYYALIEKEVYDKETGAITIETTRFEASHFENYNTSGTMKKIVFSGVAAKQMTDRFTVTIYNANGEQISASYTRTIEEYILDLLSKDTTKAAMKTVAVDFLNYGAAAQDKFGYRTTELANRGLTAELQALATADSAIAGVTDARVKGALLAGTAVSAEFEIIPATVYQNSKLTNVVKAEVSYVNFKGQTVSYEVAAADFADYNISGTMKKIEIKGTAVADGASPITVKLIDANGNVVDETVECVNYYCARMAADHEVFTMLLKVIYSAKVAFA